MAPVPALASRRWPLCELIVEFWAPFFGSTKFCKPEQCASIWETADGESVATKWHGDLRCPRLE